MKRKQSSQTEIRDAFSMVPEWASNEQRRREEDKIAAAQKLKLRALDEALEKLNRYCLPAEFRFPPKDLLDRISEIVKDEAFDLAIDDSWKRTKRSRKTRPPKDYFKRVDRRWPRLHLYDRVERLFKRAGKHTPSRPIETLLKLAKGSAAEGQTTRALLRLLKMSIKRIDPSSQDWERFAPLLLKLRNEERLRNKKKSAKTLDSPLESGSGSAILIAYTAFLELALEDVRWLRDYGDDVDALRAFARKNLILQENLDRFNDKTAAEIAVIELSWAQEERRENVRERQRKHRAKKSAAKA